MRIINRFVFINRKFNEYSQLNKDNQVYIKKVCGVKQLDFINTQEELDNFLNETDVGHNIYGVFLDYNENMIFHSFPVQYMSMECFDQTSIKKKFVYQLYRYENDEIHESDETAEFYCSDKLSNLQELIRNDSKSDFEEHIVPRDICGFIKTVNHDVNKPSWYIRDIIFKIYKCNGTIINSQTINVRGFVNKIKEDKPFTFLRIGDGEQYSIVNYYNPQYFWKAKVERKIAYKKFIRNTNKNGCTFSTELGKEFIDLLNDENIIKETQTGNLMFMFNPQTLCTNYLFQSTFKEHFKNTDAVFYREPGILGRMIIDYPQDFKDLIDYMNTKNIIFVGPARSRSIEKVIKYKTFIELPAQNSHSVAGTLFKQISNILDNNAEQYFIVLQGGLGIKRMIYDLHLKYKGKHWIFDMGSPIDVFLGCSNRRYADDGKANKCVELVLGKS